MFISQKTSRYSTYIVSCICIAITFGISTYAEDVQTNGQLENRLSTINPKADVNIINVPTINNRDNVNKMGRSQLTAYETIKNVSEISSLSGETRKQIDRYNINTTAYEIKNESDKAKVVIAGEPWKNSNENIITTNCRNEKEDVSIRNDDQTINGFVEDMLRNRRCVITENKKLLQTVYIDASNRETEEDGQLCLKSESKRNCHLKSDKLNLAFPSESLFDINIPYRLKQNLLSSKTSRTEDSNNNVLASSDKSTLLRKHRKCLCLPAENIDRLDYLISLLGKPTIFNETNCFKNCSQSAIQIIIKPKAIALDETSVDDNISENRSRFDEVLLQNQGLSYYGNNKDRGNTSDRITDSNENDSESGKRINNQLTDSTATNRLNSQKLHSKPVIWPYRRKKKQPRITDGKLSKNTSEMYRRIQPTKLFRIRSKPRILNNQRIVQENRSDPSGKIDNSSLYFVKTSNGDRIDNDGNYARNSVIGNDKMQNIADKINNHSIPTDNYYSLFTNRKIQKNGKSTEEQEVIIDRNRTTFDPTLNKSVVKLDTNDVIKSRHNFTSHNTENIVIHTNGNAEIETKEEISTGNMFNNSVNRFFPTLRIIQNSSNDSFRRQNKLPESYISLKTLLNTDKDNEQEKIPIDAITDRISSFINKRLPNISRHYDSKSSFPSSLTTTREEYQQSTNEQRTPTMLKITKQDSRNNNSYKPYSNVSDKNPTLPPDRVSTKTRIYNFNENYTTTDSMKNSNSLNNEEEINDGKNVEDIPVNYPILPEDDREISDDGSKKFQSKTTKNPKFGRQRSSYKKSFDVRSKKEKSTAVLSTDYNNNNEDSSGLLDNNKNLETSTDRTISNTKRPKLFSLSKHFQQLRDILENNRETRINYENRLPDTEDSSNYYDRNDSNYYHPDNSRMINNYSNKPEESEATTSFEDYKNFSKINSNDGNIHFLKKDPSESRNKHTEINNNNNDGIENETSDYEILSNGLLPSIFGEEDIDQIETMKFSKPQHSENRRTAAAKSYVRNNSSNYYSSVGSTIKYAQNSTILTTARRPNISLVIELPEWIRTIDIGEKREPESEETTNINGSGWGHSDASSRSSSEDGPMEMFETLSPMEMFETISPMEMFETLGQNEINTTTNDQQPNKTPGKSVVIGINVKNADPLTIPNHNDRNIEEKSLNNKTMHIHGLDKITVLDNVSASSQNTFDDADNKSSSNENRHLNINANLPKKGPPLISYYSVHINDSIAGRQTGGDTDTESPFTNKSSKSNDDNNHNGGNKTTFFDNYKSQPQLKLTVQPVLIKKQPTWEKSNLQFNDQIKHGNSSVISPPLIQQEPSPKQFVLDRNLNGGKETGNGDLQNKRIADGFITKPKMQSESSTIKNLNITTFSKPESIRTSSFFRSPITTDPTVVYDKYLNEKRIYPNKLPSPTENWIEKPDKNLRSRFKNSNNNGINNASSSGERGGLLFDDEESSIDSGRQTCRRRICRNGVCDCINDAARAYVTDTSGEVLSNSKDPFRIGSDQRVSAGFADIDYYNDGDDYTKRLKLADNPPSENRDVTTKSELSEMKSYNPLRKVLNAIISRLEYSEKLRDHNVSKPNRNITTNTRLDRRNKKIQSNPLNVMASPVASYPIKGKSYSHGHNNNNNNSSSPIAREINGIKRKLNDNPPIVEETDSFETHSKFRSDLPGDSSATTVSPEKSTIRYKNFPIITSTITEKTPMEFVKKLDDKNDADGIREQISDDIFDRKANNEQVTHNKSLDLDALRRSLLNNIAERTELDCEASSKCIRNLYNDHRLQAPKNEKYPVVTLSRNDSREPQSSAMYKQTSDNTPSNVLKDGATHSSDKNEREKKLIIQIKKECPNNIRPPQPLSCKDENDNVSLLDMDKNIALVELLRKHLVRDPHKLTNKQLAEFRQKKGEMPFLRASHGNRDDKEKSTFDFVNPEIIEEYLDVYGKNTAESAADDARGCVVEETEYAEEELQPIFAPVKFLNTVLKQIMPQSDESNEKFKIACSP